jgi:hypothetical protein
MVQPTRHYDNDNDSSLDSHSEYDEDSDTLSENDSIVIEMSDDEYEVSENFGANIFRNIFYDEIHHLDSVKTNDSYYIGICSYSIRQNSIIFANSISPKTFLKFTFQLIMDYLKSYSIIYIKNPKLHIMKLQIDQDGTYNVLLKTHWIRLIQRHWKRVYKEKKEILTKRRSIQSIKSFELKGKYEIGLRILPTLKGMLTLYNK